LAIWNLKLIEQFQNCPIFKFPNQFQLSNFQISNATITLTFPVTPSYYTGAVLIALGVLAGIAVGAVVVRLLWLADRQALAASAARLEAERDAALREADAERTRSDETHAQAQDAFAAVSRAALKENRDEFLQNAGGLLTPLKETLTRVQEQLTQVDLKREGAYRAVATQLATLRQDQEQLRSATEGLSRSLGSPNVRGTWGEIQLRRVVELAGMLAHCDFAEKISTSESGARQTPDLIIRLPGEATIVVDSKVPITAFRAGIDSPNELSRQDALSAHVRQVRDHIKSLGAKAYWKTFQPGPDYVVMFVPLDSLMTSAFEHDNSLFDLAIANHVVIATPMTLLAMLKAAAAGWNTQRLAENTEEIQRIGRELYDRLRTMVDHAERVGANLQQAADSYNRFIGSLEQNVLPGARRFKELGVASTKDVPELDPLQLDIRAVVKPELTVRRDLLDTGNDREH